MPVPAQFLHICKSESFTFGFIVLLLATMHAGLDYAFEVWQVPFYWQLTGS